MSIVSRVNDLTARVVTEFKAQKPYLNTVVNQAAVSGYAGTLTRLLTADGSTYDYVAGSSLAPVGNLILPATGKGTGRWLKKALSCNVVTDFQADNTAATDSSAVFQAAINYARSLTALNGGLYRMRIEVPSGWYLIRTTLDMTNTNGVWLTGSTSAYINSGLIGCTSAANGTGAGIIVDLTGSSFSGLMGISLTADSAWGAVASKVAVQFSLSQDAGGNQIGGLNCQLNRCYIQLYDSTTVNNGLGTIGVLNCRSEEFGIADTTIKANLPILCSNRYDVPVSSGTYTITSPTATVATFAGGSMGATNCTGQMSLLSIQKRQPAIMLVNANSFKFFGYMGRAVASAGTEESAVKLVGQCDNVHIMGTIESYSRIVKGGTVSRQLHVNVVTANHATPTTESFDFTGTALKDTHIEVTYTNPPEFNNGRIFLYHAPIDGGDSPATGNIMNSEFHCSEWADNTQFISANLLKQSANCRFYSGQPFAKRGPALVDLKSYPVPLGTVANGNPAIVGSILRFSKGDRVTKANTNGGYYHVVVRGVVRSGLLYQTGGNVVAEISGSAIAGQAYNSTPNVQGTASQLTILTKTATNAAYIDITGVTLSIDLSGAIGKVNLSVANSGSGVGETLVFSGTVEFTGDFGVNQSVIFN
ncbi:hypothetical protein GCM10027578_22420 [Spirosoma luteolum]